MIGKVTFDVHVNVLEKKFYGDVSQTFTKPGPLSKIKGP